MGALIFLAGWLIAAFYFTGWVLPVAFAVYFFGMLISENPPKQS